MSNPSNPFLKLAASCVAFALTAPALQATVLDLGSSGSGFLGGAFFSTTDIHPTGTGVIDPFMTVHNSPWQQGYNSSAGNFDTQRVPQWNHEIQLADLRITNLDNVDYIAFTVDINEPGGGRATISLDSLRIYISPTLQNSTSTDSNGFFNGSLGTLVFDLGAGNTLKYDDQQMGSGSGDLNIFIPLSNFDGAQLTDYVYMYQRWGNTDPTEGGFEETWISGLVPIPEMGTFFPVIGLIVAVLSTHALRRRKVMQLARQQSISR
jgi:hypothetical protein